VCFFPHPDERSEEGSHEILQPFGLQDELPDEKNSPRAQINMIVVSGQKESVSEKVKPLCPVFGECGGCHYQDVPYRKELRIKESLLEGLLQDALPDLADSVFEAIVPSPQPYHYRNRLDLKLLRTRNKEIFVGFSPEGRYRVIPVESCAIARQEISDFLPELKRQAIAKLPAKYRMASLVVRTGERGEVHWGGIGRRSLQLDEKDYFYTEIEGRKIFYSLDTFFQANLSILPLLMERIKALNVLNKRTSFYETLSFCPLTTIIFI